MSSDRIDIATLRRVPRTVHGESVAGCAHPDLGIDFHCAESPTPHDFVQRDIHCGGCGRQVAGRGPIYADVLDAVRTRVGIDPEAHADGTTNSRWCILCERCGTANYLTSRQVTP